MRNLGIVLGIMAAGGLGACAVDHRVGDDALGGGDSSQQASALIDELWIETSGVKFRIGCARAAQFQMGGSCGASLSGVGPSFVSQACVVPGGSNWPAYSVSVLFRNFSPFDDVMRDASFDLADPKHEHYVTVMMEYVDEGGEAYEYCSAPATSRDPTPASTGTIQLGTAEPDPNRPGAPPTYADLTDVAIPAVDGGGPALRIVSGRLYF